MMKIVWGWLAYPIGLIAIVLFLLWSGGSDHVVGLTEPQLRPSLQAEKGAVISRTVDVHMVHNGQPPLIAVLPDTLTAGQTIDQQITRTLRIQNDGETPLTWSVMTDSSSSVVLGMDSEASPAGYQLIPQPATALDGSSKHPGPDFVDPVALQGVAVSELASGARANGTAVSLIVDDASAEKAMGVTGQFVWLNRFTPEATAYPFFLEEVWVAFFAGTGIQINDTIEIYIYVDKDGDNDPATNATLAGAYSGAVVHLLGWNVYALENRVLLNGPGDVLIGIKGITAGAAAGAWPAFLDMTSSLQRSYWGPPTMTEPPTLNGLVDDTGSPGNWLLRGYGDQDPACHTPQTTPWIDLSLSSGQTAGGAETAVVITIDSTELATGTYTATLCIQSNDLTRPLVRVPVTLTVCDQPTAVTELTVSRNNGNSQINWTGNSHSYDVWWGIDDPYFEPGQDCAGAANCATQATSSFTHAGGMGNSEDNFTYVVTAVNRCGAGSVISPLSTRQGEFDFGLQPGN